MKWGKIIVYSILVLLSLEVIKTFVSRSRLDNGYMIAVIISCLQVLYCLFVATALILYPLLRKHLRFPLVAVLVFFGAMISFTEWYFVYMLHHPEKIPRFLKNSYGYYYDFFERSIIQFEADKVAYHPELTYTLKPSGDFTFQNLEFDNRYRTNRIGVRDEERDLTDPEIIFIGDSFTMGWGVEQNECFPALIQQQTGLTALNTGVSSYGTARELLMLNRIEQKKLRHLVIQYCANDLVENTSFLENNNRLPVTPQSEFDSVLTSYGRHRKYFPGKVFLMIAQHYVKSLINRIVYIFPLPSERATGVPDESEHARKFADVLLHSPVDFNKVQMVVIRLNELGFLKRNFISELKKIAMKSPYLEKFGRSLTALDLQPVLKKEDYYILDVHLNAGGHRKVANAVLSALQLPK